MKKDLVNSILCGNIALEISHEEIMVALGEDVINKLVAAGIFRGEISASDLVKDLHQVGIGTNVVHWLVIRAQFVDLFSFQSEDEDVFFSNLEVGQE